MTGERENSKYSLNSLYIGDISKMLTLKLKKPVKTVVQKFGVDAEGKKTDKVENKRTVEVKDVEVPQYANLAEAVTHAGSEDKVTEYLNLSVKADAVARVRTVGLSFSTDDGDASIISKGLELARGFNPFTDKRRGESVKAKAEKMDKIEGLLASGASDEDILAAIRGGKI